MSTETSGFDLLYQIDRDSLLAALDRILVQNMALRLSSLNLGIPINGAQNGGAPVIPAGTLQNGTLQLTSVPEASLTMPTTPDGDLILQVDFPDTLLTLQAVPALVGLNVFAGLLALAPASAGQLRITITLRLDGHPASGRLEVEFDKVSVVVSPLAAIPALGGLSPTNGVNVATYAIRINDAIAVQVNAALGQLPVRVNLPFGARGLCDIGLRTLIARLLPADGTHQASLGFFGELTDGGDGNIANATTSTLDPAVEGSFALANDFVLKLVCCLIQRHPSIAGLGEPTSHPSGCCRWDNVEHVSFDGQTVTLEHMLLCIERTGVTAKFTVDIHVTKGGHGWTSHATAKFDLDLQQSGNAIDATPANIELDNWIHKEWWVWLIEALVVIAGAVIGFLLGGPTGAVAGGAIALAIVAVGDLIISTLLGAAAGAVSGALGTLGATGMKLLPQELTDTFGGLSGIDQFEFDDLTVGGPVKKPATNVLHEGFDIVLNIGDRFDLDRGIVFRAGAVPVGGELDADLIWRSEPLVNEASMAMVAPSSGGCATSPAEMLRRINVGVQLPQLEWYGTNRSLSPLGSARVVALTGTSFWSLTEREAKAVSYPGALGVRIAGSSLPESSTAYPPGTRVFVARTTAGRFAKCAAWKDGGGSLHLAYATWDTPLPLNIRTQWAVTRGPEIASPQAFAHTYQVSRHGSFEAQLGTWLPWIFGLPEPTSEWFWNGVRLQDSGTLSDGTTQFEVDGKYCRLTTAMGKPLSGLLQVRTTLPWVSYVADREFDFRGTETIFDFPPVFESFDSGPTVTPIPPARPIVPPLIEQLPLAIAKGMKIPLEQVLLR